MTYRPGAVIGVHVSADSERPKAGWRHLAEHLSGLSSPNGDVSLPATVDKVGGPLSAAFWGRRSDLSRLR
jgi:hypothetical protein